MLCHPFCAGQMRVERASRAIRLMLRIDMQHQFRHFAPVCSLRVGIKHSQISYDVLLVVHRENGVRRRNVGNVGI